MYRITKSKGGGRFEKQIQAFIKRHPDMKVLEERTILPFEYHSDGFYMCLLEKGE